MKYELGNVVVKKRSRLPHWQVECGIYFVTWNLADAIPATARDALHQECEMIMKRYRDRGTIMVRADLELAGRIMRRLINRTLDQNLGSCLLRNGAAAKIVADAIQHFDGERYQLFAWCVMPNHVHTVFTCVAPFVIDQILHSWKSFTGLRVNSLLGRKGMLWQDDYMDRTMRNSGQLERTIRYVMNNPGAAGLAEWPYSKMYPERIATAVQ